jgi:diguanylate cyclase (GGDEF)-like protein
VAGALVAMAGAGIALGWGVTWAVERRDVSGPLEHIADSMETLAARDLLALVDEFANLAQGDDPHQLVVHATPVPLPAHRSVRRVADALNTTISRLQAGAFQFSAASEEPCRRLFYVGPDDYLLGCSCAEVMGGLLPAGGQVLMLAPRIRHAGVELRRRGFQSTLRERFPGVEVVGVVESRTERARTAETVKAFINTHPRLAGIYCTEAMGVLGAIDALAGTERAGKVAVICHDLLEGTIAGVQAGLISTAVTQDPYGQGHDTPIYLFNALAHGWRPPESRIITASQLITPENYRQYWRPYEGIIESPAMAQMRPRPLGPSRRHLRIALLGLDDVDFWAPVRSGFMAAAEELAEYNASVEWIVPEKDQRFDVSVRGPAVEDLVSRGYDALATAIYDSDLVPYLNRAVDRGVLVATLNTESSSLQGLVATLSKARKRLEAEATGLEIAARHDALTGAYNRLVMSADLEEVKTAVADGKRPATAIMIDLDHFKAYNDKYGHAAGDDILRVVARRVQQETRPGDRLYRYGGEEFLVLLRETGLDEGEAVATRIACAITTLGLVHEGNQPWGIVTVSAGVAAMDPSGKVVRDFVADADAALYRSKRSGRNTVATFQPEPNADSLVPGSPPTG